MKMPKKYVIVMDTETCPIDSTIEKVSPSNMLVYNIGYQLMEWTSFEVIVKRSFIVREVFYGMREYMKSAYYANKIPMYLDDMGNGNIKMDSIFAIRDDILYLCANYNVVGICFHNAMFDVGALNTTIQTLTETDYTRFFPNYIEIWDSLKSARSIISKRSIYRQWCKENGYYGKNNQPRASAEVLYRFIIKNNDFVEEHRAIEDVEIETVILQYLKHQKKPLNIVLYKAEG